MKKMLTIIVLLLLSIITYMVYNIGTTSYYKVTNNLNKNNINSSKNENKEQAHTYHVFRYDSLDKSFKTQEKAIEYAHTLTKSYIQVDDSTDWVWDNFKEFIVYSNDTYLKDFDNFNDAYEYAKNYKFGRIAYKNNNNIIWDRQHNPVTDIKLDIEKIYQYPELPRGCEVTALTMLLNYIDIEINKIELAKNIKKQKGRYEKDGVIYYGDPNSGFVGNMYNLSEFGFGVYVDPIYDLTLDYIPNYAINLTGSDFDDLYKFIAQGSPVWIVTNTTFKPLKEEQFNLWQTENGQVSVTLKQHAVLVTGYDDKYIYFNDPLNKAEKAEKSSFIEAWKQLGSQAVSVAPIK